MTLLHEPDYGTPASTSPECIDVVVDGIPVSVPVGTSVMRAAADAGVGVPKLCATDSLQPFGSCRLCLVEIDGKKGTPASCTTPCEPGMVVRTQTQRVEELRRNVMELYISDHPEDCDGCGFCLQHFVGPALVQESPEDPVRVERTRCNGCGVCLHVCPKGSIQPAGGGESGHSGKGGRP